MYNWCSNGYTVKFPYNKMTARRSLIDLREVNILLNLVNDSSMNVRVNALDTLTHLPLPEQGWSQVVKFIRQELKQAKSSRDKAALLSIGAWVPVPYLFDPENEVRKIEADSVKQKELLDDVRKIQHQDPRREDHDREWESSQAPGFVLFSESEWLTRKSYLESQLPIVTSKLSNWWFDERPKDLRIKDPVLITLLFEWAAKDDNYYKVLLINKLLENLARIEDFQPDLYGLFEEYLRCVNDWIRYSGKPNACCFQLDRDDENIIYGWRSWQIAWTVSRGGLKGLISALKIHLTADDETRQLAALALIADSADYVLQRSAAIFGGGVRPSRSAPQGAIYVAQTLVPIFFATDRQRTGDSSPKKFYSGIRGELEFGIIEVSIPEDHKMGQLEKPKWWKLEFRENPAKHIVLLDIKVLEKLQFWTELRTSIKISSESDLLVFIHGYNVSFEDAARRTAQIAYDLHFPGIPILYSWPSEAETEKYIVDENNIQWTVPHFRDFLNQVLSDVGARHVNVIAHSMGNRALVEALRSLDSNALPEDSASLRQIVFAAPDIDADIFRDFAQEFWQNAERFTLYASSKDKALIASKIFHGPRYPRAGDTGTDIVVVKGVDTIDASEVDTSLIGHSYFGDNRSILTDLFSLFNDGHPPHKRFGLVPREWSGLRYWLFQP